MSKLNNLLSFLFPQGEPVERSSLFPVGVYTGGQIGLAFPSSVVDAVLGPARAARGELGDYQTNREDFIKAGNDVAGAAMVGGLAAPRQRRVAKATMTDNGPIPQPVVDGYPAEYMLGKGRYGDGPTQGPMIVYHGTAAPQQFETFNRPPWLSDSPDIASAAAWRPDHVDVRARLERDHGITFNEGPPRVFKAEINPRNPYIISRGQTPEYSDPFAMARSKGHDFIIYTDAGADFGVKQRHMQIVPLNPGTVRSATTGDLLYSNGGRPGAAYGAINNLLSTYGKPPRQWTDDIRPGDI